MNTGPPESVAAGAKILLLCLSFAFGVLFGSLYVIRISGGVGAIFPGLAEILGGRDHEVLTIFRHLADIRGIAEVGGARGAM
ncbi:MULTISPECIES: hypothetical protein [unclassified Streptomyces]|uniref:hypothetical protein n=1 Tax=unclassified Streptomyces TaxID=2593676 RepID=UPI00131C4492|nr:MULTISPECIES: hypothetical protein [unclassified Streptomyces]